MQTSGKKFSAFGAAAFIAAALALPAAQAQPAAKPDGAMQGSSMPSTGMDMKPMMKRMSDKMASMPTTGNQDVDFAMMMRVHHQGAIDMAEMELKNGKEPEMKKMAKGIIAAQKKEIAQFDKFLAQHQKMK